MKTYSHIIWDWNGTLLDDANHAMNVMNEMLNKRGMPVMNHIADYHRSFVFPIIDFYKNVGFDFEKESFEDLASEFITCYHENHTGNSPLHKDVECLLKKINEAGITQIILSASKHENLLLQVEAFPIKHYFEEVLGLSDIYAKSKVEIGLDYIKNNNVEKALLIGDSTHDYEVAKALGADCILMSIGHQSKEILETCGVPVVDNVLHILDFIEEKTTFEEVM